MADISVWKEKSRLALLIGIDDYPGENLHSLKGCVNDIDSLEAVLAGNFDFAVLCLRNGEATRARILEAMAEMLKSATENQQIVFAWSGHGSTLSLPSGDVFETLVPYDSSRDGNWENNRDITDRELFGWVWQVSERTPFLTLVIDGCHSGSIVRDFQARARGAAGDHGASTAIAEDKTAFTSSGFSGLRAGDGKSGWLPVSDRYTLLAACLSSEYCREFDDPDTGLRRGLFSYHLHRALIDLKNKLTWRDLFDEVAAAVTRDNGKQHPQLEGKMDLAIFGQEVFKPRLFLPVLSLEGDRIALDGGAAHGVHLGSVWSLQPPVSRQAGEGSLGTLRIERVGPTRSVGRLLDPRRPQVEYAGLRAFETSRPVDARYRVLLDPAAAADRKLIEMLEESPYLHLQPGADGEAGDVALHLIPARQACPEGGPLPQVPRIEVKSWAFVDPQSGAQLAPLHSAASHGHHQTVLHKLETLARHAFLMRLSHPGEAAAAHDTVEVKAYRIFEDAAGTLLEERQIADDEILEPGHRIAFRLVHRNPLPLHVTVLSLGLTGGIEQLFPVRGRSQPVAAGSVLEIGFQQADALEIRLPDIYPFPGETKPELVDDHLLFLFTEVLPESRGFATPGPVPSARGELWEQEALRSRRKPVKGKATPLELAFRVVRGGQKVREGLPVDALANQETWGLVRWKLRLRP